MGDATAVACVQQRALSEGSCAAAGCCAAAVRLPALVWLPWILEEGCTELPQRDLLLGLTEVSETPLGTR